MARLELWCGPECTVNRVADTYRDQLRLTGHDGRASDLELIADLGITAVRYPVLWERVDPLGSGDPDWGWSDERLAELRRLHLRPIVGLVHHGSGPATTNLLADDFASGLASHARAVAERYPWVTDWTPVNEPCTTARFACQYGHWYPHHRDERSFWLALIQQVDGTRLAMREIRKVNPGARLVQTDDLGRTYATVATRDQAAFNNVRRWMGWDLLCGKVGPGHPFWTRLCDSGFEDRLRAILDDPCRPDIIGVNHYLTSDRFLDHRVRRYPERLRGGNHTAAFVDTEAVRVLVPPPPGLIGVLREAWERYRIPLAVTEVHNGCTREEQMRWTWEAWTAAQELRAEGVDIRAVTNWAVFGSSGWNTLLTAPGIYEPGAYDVSGGSPRPTALVPMLKSLARGEEPKHPVLGGDGWWRRDIRFHHPKVSRPAPTREHRRTVTNHVDETAPPILIVGATGRLGQALAAAARHRHLAHVLTGREQLDLTRPDSIADTLDHHRPWAVINAAAGGTVDEAEEQPVACAEIDLEGAVRLAAACAARGIASVGFSAEHVFDGTSGRAYVETDPVSPVNAYGRIRSSAERAIAALDGPHLLVRTSTCFSPWGAHNFALDAMQALAAYRRFQAVDDHVISPTYLPDLCNAVLDLAIDGERGIWHISNATPVSWADFARMLALHCGLDEALVEGRTADDLGWRARRPRYAALASEKAHLLPDLDDAVGRFARDLRASGRLLSKLAA